MIGVTFDTSAGDARTESGTSSTPLPMSKGMLTFARRWIRRALVRGRQAGRMGKVKASKVAGLKPKKKCCRKKTRCLECPVVVMRMRKVENDGLSKKELRKYLDRARAA